MIRFTNTANQPKYYRLTDGSGCPSAEYGFAYRTVQREHDLIVWRLPEGSAFIPDKLTEPGR